MLATATQKPILRAVCGLFKIFKASLIWLVFWLVVGVVTIQIHLNPECAKNLAGPPN